MYCNISVTERSPKQGWYVKTSFSLTYISTVNKYLNSYQDKEPKIVKKKNIAIKWSSLQGNCNISKPEYMRENIFSNINVFNLYHKLEMVIYQQFIKLMYIVKKPTES